MMTYKRNKKGFIWGNEPLWKMMVWTICALIAIPLLLIAMPFAWLYTKMFQ